MKEIFYELIKEACDGEVYIDNEPWPCGFNTRIFKDGQELEYFNENNKSILVIKEEDRFFDLLDQYIELEIEADRKYYKIYSDVVRNKVKAIMTYMFVNANTEEFLNPEDMLRRRISFLNDNTFNYLDDGDEIVLEDFMFNSNIKVKRSVHPLVMETPYKMEISLVNRDNINEVECPLADITYGIADESGEKVCYVYSVMKPKEKKDISVEEKAYQKKVNRALYKLNDGVMEQEGEEFIAYKNGESDYYPENITDVTHGFVLALTTFISLLQKEEITKIRAVPYLPVRYLGREVAASKVLDDARRLELVERNDRIQSNATEKFIRTFRRVAYHMEDAMELWGLPYEQDEYLTYKLYGKQEKLNNEMLEQVSEAVLELEKGKSL